MTAADRPDLPGKNLQQFVLPPAVPGQQVGRGPFPTCSRVIEFGICTWISGRFIPCMRSDSIHYLYKHAVSLGWMESDRMHGMKRPNIQEQMPNPMTLEQIGKGPRPTCWPGTAGGRTKFWRSLLGRSGQSVVIIFLLCYILA